MSSYDPAWAKRWRVDRDRGIARYVDPVPVAAHVQALLDAGASRRAVADAAGISASSITRVMNQPKHIRRVIAAALMRVTPAMIFNRTGHEDFVPDFGAKRRLHALNAIGHNAATIATAMGEDVTPAIPRNIANNPGRWISRLNYERTLRAYAALWDQPGTCPRVRGQARRFGYAPPMAWDDDTIDNPLATPHLGEAGPLRAGRPIDDLLEDLQFLLHHEPTATADYLAQRLGFADRSGIQNALARAGRRDLLDQLARNATLAGHPGGRRTA